jgi:hypothetical protein
VKSNDLPFRVIAAAVIEKKKTNGTEIYRRGVSFSINKHDKCAFWASIDECIKNPVSG